MNAKALLSGPNLLMAGLVVVLSFVYIYLNKIPLIHEPLLAANAFLNGAAGEYGIIGAFLICVFSSASILVQIPYFPIIAYLGGQADNWLALLLLIIISGAGLALGEAFPYLVGKGVKVSLKGENRFQVLRIKNFAVKPPRLIPVIVFVFAATPLADDLLLIALGMINYGMRRLILPMVAGKFTIAGAIVFGGHYLAVLAPTSSVARWFGGTGFLYLLLLFAVWISVVNIGALFKKDLNTAENLDADEEAISLKFTE